jgi:hypothetical protein
MIFIIKQFGIFKDIIEKNEKFEILSLDHGSNVFKLNLNSSINHQELKNKLYEQQIMLPNWNESDHCFYIKMNDSLVYNDMRKIVNAFLKF